MVTGNGKVEMSYREALEIAAKMMRERAKNVRDEVGRNRFDTCAEKLAELAKSGSVANLDRKTGGVAK